MKKKPFQAVAACICFLFGTVVNAQIKTITYQKDFIEGSIEMTSVQLNRDVAFVSNDKNKAVEITCIDNNTNKKWSAKVEGYYQDARLLGNNLVIVVTTDFNSFTNANSTFKAYLIDAEKGTVTKSKILYNGNNNYHTFQYILVSKDKKTLTLATRETALKRNVKIELGMIGSMYTLKKVTDQINRNTSFNVLTFDENLDEKGAISPILPDGDFIGIQKTINDDLYIAVSQNTKGIIISKYLPGSEKPVKEITEPYSFYGGWLGVEHLNEHITFLADTISNDVVYVTGSFKTGKEYITIYNRYDFAGNNNTRFKKSFTKNELRVLEKSFVPVNKRFKKLVMGIHTNFELAKVVSYENGYFMILTDYSLFRYTSPEGAQYTWPTSCGLIVYNLDKEMKIKTVSTIPRYYRGTIRASLKIHCKNDALYLFTSQEKKANFLIARINGTTGKLEEMQLGEPAKADKADNASLSDAVITDDTIILPVFDYKLISAQRKYDINLYKLSW